jgi:DNA-binding transcriptional regulator YdaS (Cro superfamily)
LRTLVQRFGSGMVAGAAGRHPATIHRYVRGEWPIPHAVAKALAGLLEVKPMTSRELGALVSRIGGHTKAARALGVTEATLHVWLDGHQPVPMWRVPEIRALWEYTPRPREPADRRGWSRDVPGSASMPAREARACVVALGGTRRAAFILGIASGSLSRYGQGAVPVPSIVAAALRYARERLSGGEAPPLVAVKTQALVADLRRLPYRYRRRVCRPDGRPQLRNASEVAADTELVIAVVENADGPVDSVAMRAHTGLSVRDVRLPLRRAVRAGRLLRRRGQGTFVYTLPAGGAEQRHDDRRRKRP